MKTKKYTYRSQQQTNKVVERTGFDFDGVLDSNSLMQLLASSMYTFKCIITKRNPLDDNTDVFLVAKLCGIPNEQVYFTNQQPKSPIINQLNLTKFFDDDPINIQDIRINTTCQAILVKSIKNP